MNKEEYNFIGNKLAEARLNINDEKKATDILIEIEDFICTNTKNKDI